MEYRFNHDDKPATLEMRNPDPNVSWGYPGAPHNELQIGLLLYQCNIPPSTLFTRFRRFRPLAKLSWRSVGASGAARTSSAINRSSPSARLRRGERLWAVGGVLAGIVLTAGADIVVRLVAS
jgi:hypothetical protein